MSTVGTRGFFVTGTDTGVGKTIIASGIVRVLARRGHSVIGLKPVASGAIRTPQGIRSPDALALAAASTVTCAYQTTNPHCFEPPIAPHLAAREADSPIRVDDLVSWYEGATHGARFAIVEGAGGWRVPLHPDGFLSDLPERLGLGVILVVGLRLGCLNHAVLTAESIARGGRCRLVGWIGNQVDPGFERLEANLETLSRLLGGPALVVLPALPDASASAAAQWLDRAPLLSALGAPP